MQFLLGRLGCIPSGIIENLDGGDPELMYFLDHGRRVVSPALEPTPLIGSRRPAGFRVAVIIVTPRGAARRSH